MPLKTLSGQSTYQKSLIQTGRSALPLKVGDVAMISMVAALDSNKSELSKTRIRNLNDT
jgi:hypothetical protein